MKKITILFFVTLTLLSAKVFSQCPDYKYFTTNEGWTSENYNAFLLFNVEAKDLTDPALPKTGAESGKFDNVVWGDPLVYRAPYGSGIFTTPIYTWDDDTEDWKPIEGESYPISYSNCVFAPTHRTSAYDKWEVYGEEPSGKNDPCTKNDGTVLANGMYESVGFIELNRDKSLETEASKHGYIQIDNLRQIERIQWSYSSTSWKRGVKCDIKIAGEDWKPLRWVTSDQGGYALFSEQGYKFEEKLEMEGDDRLVSIRFRVWDGDTITYEKINDGEKPEGYFNVPINPHGVYQVARIHQIKVYTYIDGRDYTGINSSEMDDSFAIYKSENNICLTAPASVEVYTIDGKLVKQEQNCEKIDMGNLGKGVYVVKAKSLSGKIKNTKIAL